MTFWAFTSGVPLQEMGPIDYKYTGKSIKKSYIIIDNRKILMLDGATRTLHDDICEVNPEIDVLSHRDFLAVTGGICEAHVVRNGKILDVGEIQGRIGQCVDNTIDLGLI